MTNGGVPELVFCPALAIAVNPPTSSAAETAAHAIVFMIHWSATTDVGPDVNVVRHPSQKMRILKLRENDIRRSGVEIPHPLRLPFRQMQPRHLGELRLDEPNPVTEIPNGRLLHSSSFQARSTARAVPRASVPNRCKSWHRA